MVTFRCQQLGQKVRHLSEFSAAEDFLLHDLLHLDSPIATVHPTRRRYIQLSMILRLSGSSLVSPQIRAPQRLEFRFVPGSFD